MWRFILKILFSPYSFSATGTVFGFLNFFVVDEFMKVLLGLGFCHGYKLFDSQYGLGHFDKDFIDISG